ncbi:sperm-associated antigen 7 [Lynx pardinus]|uniref:Sperm-associated antigen 7 n=1 Tax=Lynx pardinus TaxID=191816 RepID=A0A485N8F0_LYNPA|nr:sperm-associated antigen 7 [Lynx pardinus]
MEKEMSDFIQDSGQIKKKFQPMNEIERSTLHNMVEVAGLTSFSFRDDECLYVTIFKKEFACSDEELDSYHYGEECNPQEAEEKPQLKELAQWQENAAQQGPVVGSPASDDKDKYSRLTGKAAAKDATGHMLQANKTYSCVPMANKRDMCSIKEAMNEIQAKKDPQQSREELPPNLSDTPAL